MIDSLTVVYTSNGDPEFESVCDSLMSNFRKYDSCDKSSWGISAVSNCNEIKRLELIEEAHATGSLSLIGKILSCPDLSGVSSVNDLE